MINEQILKAFAKGVRPEKKVSIVEWAKQNAYLPQSKRSKTADLNQVPWQTEVLQTIIDNNFEVVIFNAATGSGKSTILEIVTNYFVLERPSACGFFTQSETTAQALMETRIQPSLKANKKVMELWPEDKHKVKRDSIYFKNMPLWIRGCSAGNLQSLSLDFCAVDEAWLMKKGELTFAHRRLHQRPFAQYYICSQAGKTSSEYYSYHKQARQFHYHYKCPHCGEYHEWKFTNLKFDKDDLNKGVFYQCPCGAELPDNVTTRRKMSCEGKYVEHPTEKFNPKYIAYNFTAGMNWTSPWVDLIREFLEASEASKKGDYSPLEKFRTQRLCEFWNDDEEIQFIPIRKSGYSYLEREENKLGLELMVVDVQGQTAEQSFWYTIRTYDKETGESKLMDFGRFGSYQEIVNKQNEWNLKGNQVALDCGYKTEEVKEFAANHGFLCLNGVKNDSFPIIVSGKTITRMYGKMRADRTISGKSAMYCPYASNRVRTLAAGLRSSNLWKLPHDLPEYAEKQFQAEKFENGVWKAIRYDNHFTDCDAMHVVLASIWKVRITTQHEEEETE